MKGEQVRRIRNQLGFTQEELAKKVGVHKNTVARWERNELSIRESTARLLQFVASGHARRDTRPA
jgi:transcriptional regulator with XRE-family HTH domain